MPVLDLRTIDRLAELICDLGGPYQRSVRQLGRLLEGAGWEVDYGDSARVPWLVKEIRSHNDDHAAIESLLCRVIDPREYDEGMAAAGTFVGLLNALLVADGLEVGHAGHRPFLRRLTDPSDAPTLDQVAARLASPELRATVRGLVKDAAMADILNSRLDEVDSCLKAGAYLFAVIGTGSFIEGLLYDVLMWRDPATKDQNNPALDFLLSRAHKRNWIQYDALEFGSILRDYRNFVHPREQLKREQGGKKVPFDRDTVLMCWQPVLAVINDLQRLLPPFRGRSGSATTDTVRR